MADLSPDQVADLRLTYYVACGLSLAGSQYVLWLLWRPRNRATLTTQFVFYLAICDWLTAFGGLFGAFGLDSLEEDTAEMDDTLCKVQGFVLHFCNLAAAFWSVSIAVVVYRQTVLLDLSAERFVNHFHIFNWGLPSIFMLIIVSTNQLGPQKLWCWVLEGKYNFKYYLFYIPVGLALIVGIVIYIKIQRFLSEHIRDSALFGSALPGHLILEKSVSDRTIQLVLVFFFCWCWTFVNRIYHDVHKDDVQMGLMYLNFFLTPLEGFCNAVIYGRIAMKKKGTSPRQKMISFHGTHHTSSVTSMFRSDPSSYGAVEESGGSDLLSEKLTRPLMEESI